VKTRMMVYQDRLRIDTHTEGQTDAHARTRTHTHTHTEGQTRTGSSHTRPTWLFWCRRVGGRTRQGYGADGKRHFLSRHLICMPKTVGFYHDRLGTNAEEKLRENA
jgi:hypothetical protein